MRASEAFSPTNQEAYIVDQGFFLRRTAGTPKESFLSTLYSPGSVPDAPYAKRITAFFGSLTDSMRPETGIIDRPYWVVFLEGQERYQRGHISNLSVNFVDPERKVLHFQMIY